MPPSRLQVLFLLPRIWFCIFLSWFDFIRQFVYPKQKSVAGQRVLITGAGSGLGRLLSVRFSKLGCNIIGWDIVEDNLNETARLVRLANRSCKFTSMICDVSNADDIYSKAESVLNEFGHVDIIINNAGIINGTSVMNTSDDRIVKTFEINTFAHIWASKAFLPSILKRKRGHLVFVSSFAAWTGLPRMADYCSSKAANLIFVESLNHEMNEHRQNSGVHLPITVVCPMQMNTGMFEGASSAIPNMEPTYVADRVVAGILAEQYYVILPRQSHIHLLLKFILPVSVGQLLFNTLGGNQFMDNFKGQQSLLKKSQ